jgi:hypothetical protein
MWEFYRRIIYDNVATFDDTLKFVILASNNIKIKNKKNNLP